ncbi:MAG: 1-(5-phosphoribosyl)-5-[(5-phosphoribosylamino)methylideneamino]imidazole-4-carboxamide isomerase [Gammaproteobacteria bacterium]|nr:1-(5-phosphoribosyl)-5-[(5-phosphoribosylamino)methylideneamino]imidazole-4-carboxamide isomerase [Gammaproteobacteria bacterium]|tara:strand:+ start:924 stop:1676 length:753 start_codon:yes stop_codon:yes gene_type:complete
MLLIPAIDLKDGRCVRLKQGRMSDVTVFSDDPVAMARHWADQGCRRLHLVDLDGAFAGEPRNRDLIAAITAALPELPVQVGGGIRSESVIEGYLDAGVSQVIVGTRAIEEPAFLEAIAAAYPGKVILGLDARDGRLATAGWDETSSRTAVEFAEWAGRLPIAAIVYTDIERDGMLTGVNAAATVALAEAAGVPVIASGGVSDLVDLEALRTAFRGSSGTLLGAITGRAIYAGTLDFRAGQALLDRDPSDA